ncbi:MAG: cytochrome c [Ilumatobacteraceae bacterium]
MQLLGVVLLIVVVIGLPLYWVFEPARQSGATEGAENRLAGWGGDLFETTANGGFNCAGCHGGMNGTGGAADYSITDSKTQEVKAVAWTAPAVNTVFYRYSEDEVRFILVYGRPFSPMSAWGIEGGGPMNSQQIDSLIAYLKSIQLEPADCAEGETPVDIDVGRIIEDEVVTICPSGQLPAEKREEIENAARQSVDDGTYASYGEALFNLELDSGAFSCARCHTQGWSYDDPACAGAGSVRLEPARRCDELALPQPGRHGRLHRRRLGDRGRVRHPGPGQRSHARLRGDVDRRADRRSRRVRARSVSKP